jgi:hypothetical protein
MIAGRSQTRSDGVGLGTLLLPELAVHAIAAFGWRVAYVVVRITTFVLSFSMVALFVRLPPGFIAAVHAESAQVRQTPCRAMPSAIPRARDRTRR